MTARRRLSALLAAVLLAAATGCGAGEEAGSSAGTQAAANVDETIEVVMDDFVFQPAAITVRAGTTVRFRFRNEGAFVHDAAIGDEAFQKAVADGKARRNGPVARPRRTADHVQTFSEPAQLLIGCHQPGHYRQGMVARLTVA